jgi:hypothetical protein
MEERNIIVFHFFTFWKMWIQFLIYIVCPDDVFLFYGGWWDVDVHDTLCYVVCMYVHAQNLHCTKCKCK